MKQIFFIDLDNTIYFTKPNEEQLMSGLYQFLDEQDLGISTNQLQAAKSEMLRTPFQRLLKSMASEKRQWKILSNT